MLEKLNEFTTSHGQLQRGKGLAPGTIERNVGIPCFLGVLAFDFPQCRTTPELRESDNVDVMRFIPFTAMVVADGSAPSRP